MSNVARASPSHNEGSKSRGTSIPGNSFAQAVQNSLNKLICMKQENIVQLYNREKDANT